MGLEDLKIHVVQESNSNEDEIKVLSNNEELNESVNDEIDINNQNEVNIDNDDNSRNDKSSKSQYSQKLLSKADIIHINNGWNDRNEQIIISIGENAAAYKWMHEKSANYHKVIHNITSIVLITLSTALSAETLIPNDSTNVSLNIIRQFMVYFVTVISIIQNFLKSQETSEKHSAAAEAFSALYHDIQQQMCRFRRDRLRATKYVSDSLKRYDSLIITNPTINSIILHSFKNTFKNTNISVPDIADRIQKIEIITEKQQPSMFNSLNNNQLNNNPLNNNPSNNTKDLSINQQQNESINNLRCNNNLADIHNVFQIHGDITDKDLENAHPIELKRLKYKLLQNKLNYEYQRYLQHSEEDD